MEEELATSWELDLIPMSVVNEAIQQKPTEEELKRIEKVGKEEVTVKELLGRVADTAEELLANNVDYKYNQGEEHTRKTPGIVVGETPSKFSNASFVYWCFFKNHVELLTMNKIINVQEVKNSRRIVDLYRVGSKINLDSLLRGDILLFNQDRHMAVYVGDKEFISMVQPSREFPEGKLTKGSLEDSKWKQAFQGHVKRLVK